MATAKDITLISGSEEGFDWSLSIGIREKTKVFNGHYKIANEERKRKALIRHMDSSFFKTILPYSMYRKYEVNHDWKNGARVTLLTPKEHRNTVLGKTNQSDRVMEEDWLEEKYKGERR